MVPGLIQPFYSVGSISTNNKICGSSAVMLGETLSPTHASFDTFREIVPWPRDDGEVIVSVKDRYQVVVRHSFNGIQGSVEEISLSCVIACTILHIRTESHGLRSPRFGVG